MLPGRIASRYAEALFGLAQQQGKTAEWEQELLSLAGVLESTPELREVLTHPEITLQHKERIVNQIFTGSISREILALLFLLIKRGHDPDMRTLYNIYLERWNEARAVQPVTVTSAVPLTENQANALVQALAKRMGTTIQLQQLVNQDLIAGLVLQIGDRVIDASARTTLNGLREAMIGA